MVDEVIELEIKHVLLFVIVAFLLYLIGGCRCGDGFISISDKLILSDCPITPEISESACMKKTNEAEDECCQDNDNCPNGYPLNCNQKCKTQIQDMLTSCSTNSDFDVIKQMVCNSCKTPVDNCPPRNL
tara:strand:+ start:735 stop:1121 length:387 start_codon:yes stop_codon:yes gene_type:complete